MIKLTIEEIDELQEYISSHTCRFDFKCYKSGFEDVSGVMVDLHGNIIECLDEDAPAVQQLSALWFEPFVYMPIKTLYRKAFR